MRLVMIPIRYTYEKKENIVLRSYVRAIEQTGIDFLISKKPQQVDLSTLPIDKYREYIGKSLDNTKAFVVGVINRDGILREYFTGGIIPPVKCRYATIYEVNQIYSLSREQKDLLRKIMNGCLFGKREDTGSINISGDSSDIVEESIAYDRGLSDIYPYEGDLMAFNNFLLKASMASDTNSPAVSREHFIDELYYHTLAYNKTSTSPLEGLAKQDLKKSNGERKK